MSDYDQLEFDLFERPPVSPCAVECAHCTSCALAVCLDSWPTCSTCDRLANLEVCVFSWYPPRKGYVTYRWAMACWWCAGLVTDGLRADVLTVGPAYLIRWTATPYGLVAGGTRAYADVEQVDP